MVSASHDHRALESTHMRISSLIALTTLQDLDEHSQYNPRESYAPAVTARQSAAALQMHINKPPGYVDFELLMNDEWVLYSASLCNDLHYWSNKLTLTCTASYRCMAANLQATWASALLRMLRELRA